MQLFYNPNIQTTDKKITFSKEESRHIVRVLRKKEQDYLHITDGKGNLFLVNIINANDKKCEAEILKTEAKSKPWNYYLHIAIAPTKNNDRLEWFLEKATEIGIDEITPIICHNSERKVVKLERLEKIVQSAMKQSLKYTLPKINAPEKLSSFITKESVGSLFIAHCEDSDKNFLKDEVKNASTVTILIGPEGDFSTNEISNAISKGYKPISLGESRLRTETAALHATSMISILKS